MIPGTVSPGTAMTQRINQEQSGTDRLNAKALGFFDFAVSCSVAATTSGSREEAIGGKPGDRRIGRDLFPGRRQNHTQSSGIVSVTPNS